MITEKEKELLGVFQKTIFHEIEKLLKIDGHCKSYEGAIQISFPSYFKNKDEENKQKFALTLDCYLIGPSRHYEWVGRTLEEAIEKGLKEVKEWIKESKQEEKEEAIEKGLKEVKGWIKESKQEEKEEKEIVKSDNSPPKASSQVAS